MEVRREGVIRSNLAAPADAALTMMMMMMSTLMTVSVVFQVVKLELR